MKTGNFRLLIPTLKGWKWVWQRERVREREREREEINAFVEKSDSDDLVLLPRSSFPPSSPLRWSTPWMWKMSPAAAAAAAAGTKKTGYNTMLLLLLVPCVRENSTQALYSCYAARSGNWRKAGGWTQGKTDRERERKKIKQDPSNDLDTNQRLRKREGERDSSVGEREKVGERE